MLSRLIQKEAHRLSMAQKFYVVWLGRQTGIFTDWGSTQRAVDKYAGARFKSFATRAEAEQALGRGGYASIPPKTASRHKTGTPGRSESNFTHPSRKFDVSIYCDGACEPNPGNAGSGIVVYRAGKLAQLWFGLYNPRGTNNTAELNALYHALRMAETEITAATRRTPSIAFAVGLQAGKRRAGKKLAARSRTWKLSRTVTRSTDALKKN